MEPSPTEPRRWGLLASSRTYVVYQETKEQAVALFADVFQLDSALIENMVYELDDSNARILVDRAPARESR